MEGMQAVWLFALLIVHCTWDATASVWNCAVPARRFYSLFSISRRLQAEFSLKHFWCLICIFFHSTVAGRAKPSPFCQPTDTLSIQGIVLVSTSLSLPPSHSLSLYLSLSVLACSLQFFFPRCCCCFAAVSLPPVVVLASLWFGASLL